MHFSRVYLKAGEETVYRFVLSPNALALFHDDGLFFFEHGGMTLYVGGSQPDERSIELGASPCVKAQFSKQCKNEGVLL